MSISIRTMKTLNSEFEYDCRIVCRLHGRWALQEGFKGLVGRWFCRKFDSHSAFKEKVILGIHARSPGLISYGEYCDRLLHNRGCTAGPRQFQRKNMSIFTKKNMEFSHE